MALGTVRSCEFPQEISRSFDRCEGFRQRNFLRIVSGVYFVPGSVPGVHSDRCAFHRSLLAELNRPRDMAVTHIRFAGAFHKCQGPDMTKAQDRPFLIARLSEPFPAHLIKMGFDACLSCRMARI